MPWLMTIMSCLVEEMICFKLNAVVIYMNNVRRSSTYVYSSESYRALQDSNQSLCVLVFRLSSPAIRK